MKIVLISIITFIIPLLTPFGYWVISYADPFLIGRDLLIDSMNTKNKLIRAWRLLIISLACIIVFFFFKKDKLAIISAVCSFISETLDLIFTMKFHSLKFRPIITVSANIFDSALFMLSIVVTNGYSELDYNIFLDTVIMSIIYLFVFFLAKKRGMFKSYQT